MVQKLNASEEEILLVPASYNKKGLLGDFKIYIKNKGLLSPFTSIGEYFNIFDDAEYVYAYLEPVKGNRMFYKITKEDYEKGLKDLEELASLPNITVI